MANEIFNIGFNPDTNTNRIVDKFNITGLPDIFNAPQMYHMYLFISRPRLNLDENWDNILRIPEMAKYAADRKLRSMAEKLGRNATNKWVPIFTNRLKTPYQIQDSENKTVEVGGTFLGHTIRYHFRNEDHKKGGSISLDFINDKDLTVFHTANFWRLYIKYISNSGYIKPHFNSITEGYIDYLSSAYLVATLTDRRTIVYTEKLLGLAPRMVPSASLFGVDNFNPKIEDSVSVEFDFTFKDDPNNPAIYEDINELSLGSDYTANDVNIYNITSPYYNANHISDNININYGRLDNAFSSNPVVVTGRRMIDGYDRVVTDLAWTKE